MTRPIAVTDLAFRLETAEAAGCQAQLRALEATKARSYGYEVARIGHTFLFSAPTSRRNARYNRALAFSSRDRAHLDQILRWLRERNAYWFDVALPLVDQPILEALVDDGLHASSEAHVLCKAPVASEGQAALEIDVYEVDLDDVHQLHDFGVVLHHGHTFSRPLVEATYRVERARYAAPSWHTYLAILEGEPAAWAAMHVADGIATLEQVNANPRMRGRGCRAALVQRCVSEAARAGCQWIAGRTRPDSDLEGTMLGAGFEIAYIQRRYSRESRAHYAQ